MFTRRRLVLAGSMLAAASLFMTQGVLAAGTTIYNTMPSPVPGNVSSLAYQATQTSEFGDQLQFAAGPRIVKDVTVLMSSWGCQSGSWYAHDCATTPGATFSHPITLNIYNVGTADAVGSLVTTKTQTFAIPYRPSADNTNCTGLNAGKWFNAADSTCYNGYATAVTFTNVNATVPNNVILSIAYNTSGYGAAPLGYATACNSTTAGCPYDSLNVGLVDPAATQTSGTNPRPADAYLNSAYGFNYCDGGVSGTGTFRLDAGCWTGFKPALTVTAAFPTANNANGCKNNGWMTLSRGDGSSFKNQGDCIQYVNTGK